MNYLNQDDRKSHIFWKIFLSTGDGFCADEVDDVVDALLTAGFAAAAMDPLNIAASFMPGVGEARMASFLGRVGLDSSTLLGRTAIRAGVSRCLHDLHCPVQVTQVICRHLGHDERSVHLGASSS